MGLGWPQWRDSRAEERSCHWRAKEELTVSGCSWHAAHWDAGARAGHRPGQPATEDLQTLIEWPFRGHLPTENI